MRHELLELLPRLGGSRLAVLLGPLLAPRVLAPLLTVWKCPQCGLVRWECDAALCSVRLLGLALLSRGRRGA